TATRRVIHRASCRTVRKGSGRSVLGRRRTTAIRRSPAGVDFGRGEDAVHRGAADRPLALGHPHTGLGDLDLALVVALLLALDAVAVVRLGLLGHDCLLRRVTDLAECPCVMSD